MSDSCCSTCGADLHHHHSHTGHSEKKFLFSTRATNNDLPINIDIMSTFNKVDKPDVRNNNRNIRYCIIFQKSEVAKEGQSLVWTYASSELRDLDYMDLRNRIATDV